MKRTSILLTSLLFLAVTPTSSLARSIDQSEAAIPLALLTATPKSEDKKEAKTLETDNGVYTFSNARMKDDILLVDLDYTNKANQEQTLWTFLAFEFVFEQDDDPNNAPLDTDIFNKEATKGYKPLDMDTKAKPGEKLKVTLALTGAKKDLPFIVQPNSTTQEPIELTIK